MNEPEITSRNGNYRILVRITAVNKSFLDPAAAANNLKKHTNTEKRTEEA